MGDHTSGDERFFTPRNSARQGGYASSGDENFATPRSGRNSSRYNNLSDNDSDFVTPREGDRGESNDEGFYSGRDESYSQRDTDRDGKRTIAMPYHQGEYHDQGGGHHGGGEYVMQAPPSGGYRSQPSPSHSPAHHQSGGGGSSPWAGAAAHVSGRMAAGGAADAKQQSQDYSHHDYRQYDYRNNQGEAADYKQSSHDQWAEPSNAQGGYGGAYGSEHYQYGQVGNHAGGGYQEDYHGYRGSSQAQSSQYEPQGAKEAWKEHEVTSGMSKIQIADPAYEAEAKFTEAEGDWDVEEIFSLARHNRGDQVEGLLDNGVPVDVRDKHGNTILSVACQNGLKRMAKIALRRGADINSQNYKGNTPLHFCHAFGYGDSLGTYIISKGADPSCRNHLGFLPSEGLASKTPR